MQCIRVQHNEAVRLCRDKAGLAASSYFPRVDVTLSNNGQPRGFVLYSQLDLENGESAWVDGYVKYGALWDHFGCYSYATVYPNNTIISLSENKEHSGFYQCSMYCEIKAMFATNATSCICFDRVNLPEMKVCPNHNGENQALDVYKRRPRYIGGYQCSSVEYILNVGWMERTSKCYGHNEIVCFLSANGTYYHVRNSTSTTWIDGVKKCNNLNGMPPPIISKAFVDIIERNRTNRYWLGAVSPYTIQSAPGNACLSVTRLDDQLVLEPEDCRAINSFICTSDLTHSSDDINVANDNSTQTTNSNAFTSSTQTPISPDSKVNIITNAFTSSTHTPISQDSNVSIIIVLVIIACCLAIIAVGFIISHVYTCMRKKNSNTERNSLNISEQNIVMTDNQVDDEVYHEYATVDDNDIVQIEVNRNRVANTPKSNSKNKGTVKSFYFVEYLITWNSWARRSTN